ncbi:MAG: hypothetical protein ACO3B9_07480, partial [Burkholderiaceae bacterium]
MNTQPLPLSSPSLRMRAVATGLLLASLLGLAACSSSGPKPAKLESFTPTLDLKAKWTVSVDRLPAVAMGQSAFAPAVSSGLVVVAGPKGQVSGFKLESGAQVFEQNLKTELAAGVG